MAMTKADLVAELKAILMDCADKFITANDADFIRHLEIAALDLSRVRPRTLLGSVTVEADVTDYSAPADMRLPKAPLWGVNEQHRTRPWNARFPGQLPRLSYVNGMLHLMPAPTAEQITLLGSTFKFYYYARHVIGDTAEETSVNAGDRHLLLIRAAAQAMQELAANGVTKPVSLGRGTASVGSMPKNGTPAALSVQLISLFEAMA